MRTTGLFVLFLFASLLATAQNFEKGTLSAHTNFGIDIYKTTYVERYRFSNLDTTITTHDTTGNRNVCFGADYAVIRRLSVGFRVKLNKYFVSENSYGTTPTANAQDYMALVNYHVVDRKVFDLSAGIGLGGSHLYYNDNIPSAGKSGTSIKGNGSYFQLQITPQFLIAQRVGLGLSYYRAFVNYRNMTTNDDQLNQHWLSNWKGSGGGFSFNINVLILKGEE